MGPRTPRREHRLPTERISARPEGGRRAGSCIDLKLTRQQILLIGDDEFVDGPVFVTHVGQEAADSDRDLAHAQLLDRNLQRVGLTLQLHHHGRIHAAQKQKGQGTAIGARCRQRGMLARVERGTRALQRT